MEKKIKILIVAGARPNFIKIAPLFGEFKKQKNIKPILVHTGQHYNFEMSKVFFKELNIPKPDYSLNVGSNSHAVQTAKIMERLGRVFLKEKPDAVIVVGDVNSTLAGALVACKMNIPICHIESGLRSYDKSMPEEINRLLVDHVSDLLFCPSQKSFLNLKKEGIKKGVYVTGDIMYDVFLKNIKKTQKKSKILDFLKLKPQKYLLLTIHRPINTDNHNNLKNIFKALAKSKENIIFPVHPRTIKNIKHLEIGKYKNIKMIKPLGYFDILMLEKNAKKIITDSGGIQKEAYFLKTPCVTLRKQTEWSETLKGNFNILVGSNQGKILKGIKTKVKSKYYKNWFGSGKAANKITEIILKKFTNSVRL